MSNVSAVQKLEHVLNPNTTSDHKKSFSNILADTLKDSIKKARHVEKEMLAHVYGTNDDIVALSNNVNNLSLAVETLTELRYQLVSATKKFIDMPL